MSYQLVDKRVIFEGRKVTLEVHQYRNEDGQTHTREVCVHPGAVVILPMLANGDVVLIRNRRFAIGETIIELPAGTLEKGEPPMNCAGRELREEPGYLAGKMLPLSTFFSSPGILSERLHVFVAYDLEKQEAALEDGEEIELLPTPLNEAIDMAIDGRIIDAKTIAALLIYDRRRKR